MSYIDYIIESKKRISGVVSDFRINLPASVHAKKIKLRYIQIPNVFYNVRTNVNDCIPLSSGNVFIPPGSYNINELTTQLTTTLGTLTTYNPITMRLVFATLLVLTGVVQHKPI